MTEDLPRTYIRIDVAHYMKNWADFLGSEKKEVKKFYMFAIGQLILCKNQMEATRIIEALLLISKSETAGEGATSLKISVDFIRNLINDTPTEIEEIVNVMLEEEENKDPAQEKETNEENAREQDKGLLTYWAISMEENVDSKLKDENGDDMNPRNCPKFATRLLKQVKTIPLWSCIRRNNFKYGLLFSPKKKENILQALTKLSAKE